MLLINASLIVLLCLTCDLTIEYSDIIISSILPLTPSLINLYQRISLTTKSKAFVKSTKAQYNFSSLFKIYVIRLFKTNTLSVLLIH